MYIKSNVDQGLTMKQHKNEFSYYKSQSVKSSIQETTPSTPFHQLNQLQKVMGTPSRNSDFAIEI